MIQKSVTLTLLLLCGAGALTSEIPAPPITTGQINCNSQVQLDALAAYVQGSADSYKAFKDPAVAQGQTILNEALKAADTLLEPTASELKAEIQLGMTLLQNLSTDATAVIDKLVAEALLTISEVKAGAPCNPVDPGFNFTDVFDYSGLLQLNISCIPTPLTLTSVKATLGNQCPCDCGEL